MVKGWWSRLQWSGEIVSRLQWSMDGGKGDGGQGDSVRVTVVGGL